jgi:hypothetical protein
MPKNYDEREKNMKVSWHKERNIRAQVLFCLFIALIKNKGKIFTNRWRSDIKMCL